MLYTVTCIVGNCKVSTFLLQDLCKLTYKLVRRAVKVNLYFKFLIGCDVDSAINVTSTAAVDTGISTTAAVTPVVASREQPKALV